MESIQAPTVSPIVSRVANVSGKADGTFDYVRNPMDINESLYNGVASTYIVLSLLSFVLSMNLLFLRVKQFRERHAAPSGHALLIIFLMAAATLITILSVVLEGVITLQFLAKVKEQGVTASDIAYLVIGFVIYLVQLPLVYLLAYSDAMLPRDANLRISRLFPIQTFNIELSNLRPPSTYPVARNMS
jgi:hypothetical protein